MATAWATATDKTSQYGILPPWGESLDEVLAYEAIQRLPDEGLAVLAGRPAYERALARVRDWAQGHRAQLARPSQHFDRVTGAESI
jgi:hypothetical protein